MTSVPIDVVPKYNTSFTFNFVITKEDRAKYDMIRRWANAVCRAQPTDRPAKRRSKYTRKGKAPR